MLNPNGPNFLLYCIIPWKKLKVKTSLCQSLFLTSHYLKNLSFKSVKDFFKFAFKPLGGSKVNLLPFWRIGTGK
jgi:hypothetical protein